MQNFLRKSWSIFFIGSLVILSGLGVLLTGCAPIAIFGVGATAIELSAQERGMSGTFSDTDIRAQINKLWFEKSVELYSHVLLAVQDGYVLLTGSVATEEDQLEAVKLAWQARGVKDVFNEIKIGKPQSVGAGLDDTWISTKIRSALIFEEGLYSSNYSVTTFDGVVYLMGIAQNPEELDKAIHIAKDTRGVKNVVSHVMIKPPSQEKAEESPTEQEENTSPEQGLSTSDNDTPAELDMSQEAYPTSPGASSIQEEKLDSPV